MSDKELLETADARIRQHRMADAEIVIKSSNAEGFRGASARIEQTRHEFLFGCNIFLLGQLEPPEDNQRYLSQFAALFNYATLPFYWGFYEPEQGRPQVERLEKMAKAARGAGIDLKGHPLIWHTVPCEWWAADSAGFEKLAEARVRREVGHFAGLIDRWDVVNEAVVAPKFDNAEGRWMGEIGPAEATARALNWSRAANPKAQLLVNDFMVDDSFTELLSEVRRRGGAFDAIGLQSHMHKEVWKLTKAWDVCEKFKPFGVPLHFTELTILSGALKTDDDWGARRTDWVSTPEGEAAQAEEVEQLYTVLFSHPSVAAITWWDFADRSAWMGAPAGLVRADLTPKPVYERLLKLIKGKWWTTLTTELAADGRVRFRGFLGEYRVTVTMPDGRRVEKSFRLERDKKNVFELSL
jgi:GH35 family endo-1,4-beta-xylanase